MDLKLKARGPYAMREYDTLYNISFFDDNRQVTYKTWTRYEFDAAASCAGCTNTDMFTAMNPGLLSAMTSAGSEIILGLVASNFDLAYGTAPQCTAESISYSLGSLCNPATDPKCCCSNAQTGAADTCGVRAASVSC